MTLIICSECGDGYYYAHGAGFACGTCDHEISRSDVTLEDGEVLVMGTRGRLGYVAFVAGVAGEFE